MVQDVSPKKPQKTDQTRPVDLYSEHDLIPVPDAIESNTDTAWGLWEDLTKSKPDAGKETFDETLPAEPWPEQAKPKITPAKKSGN